MSKDINWSRLEIKFIPFLSKQEAILYNISGIIFRVTTSGTTVESSLFVRDQFLWLSWYPLPTKHITNICLVFIEFMLNFLPTNYVPTNQPKIGYPRTLTHTNKNKSTVFMWKVFNPLKYNSCLQEFCGYIPFFVCEGYLLCLFAFRLVFQLYLCIADKNKKVYIVMCCYRQMKNTYASMTSPNV